MTVPVPAAAWVFDWNGTVVDDAERARRATNLVLGRRRLPTLHAAAFSRAFRLPVAAFMAAVGVPAEDLDPAVEEWNAAMARGSCRLAGGARALLEALSAHGTPVVVLSAAAASVVETDAARLGVRDLLGRVVADAGDKAAVLRALGADLGALVFVGDTVEDVRAGRDAGAWTIAYTGGYLEADRLHAAGPDAMCDDLADLVDLTGGDATRPGG